MSLEQGKRFWTTGEELQLRGLYPNTPIAQLMGILNRPMSAIYGKAKSLGLKRSPEFKASEHSGRLRAENNPGMATRFKKGQRPLSAKSASTKRRKNDMTDKAESPFQRHRALLIQHNYSAAQTLQLFVLSCWNGNTWQFRGDRLTNLDPAHRVAFLELAQSYAIRGESDPVFMKVCGEMIEQRRRWAAENKAKMDELAASSPDDHPDGSAEYWREMDELAEQHKRNQAHYLIDRD